MKTKAAPPTRDRLAPAFRIQGSHHIRRPTSVTAFTLTELLAVAGTVALLMAVALPLLAGNRASSDRAVCQSNLRQIGRAFNMWADDNGGLFPHQTPAVAGDPLANNAWYQFLLLTAELESPKVLICPTDKDKRPAKDWSRNPNGGFNHPFWRNSAVTYLIALGTQQHPGGFLSGDRNVQHSSIAPACLAGPAFTSVPQFNWQSPTLDWTDQLHNRSGNILLNDGSVIPAGQSELQTAVKNAVSASDTTLCVIYPN